MEIHIDTQPAIAMINMAGMSGYSDLKRAVIALLEHPEHVDCMETIYDLRNAKLESITASDMSEFARWLVPYMARLSKRLAIVVNGDLEFGIVRMWISYSEGIISQDRMIFRDMESAKKWLLSGR